MADAMTEVHAGGPSMAGAGAGYALWGRVPAGEAVAETRALFVRELERYQAALAALDAGDVHVSWRRGNTMLPDPDGQCYSVRYWGGATACAVHGQAAGWPCATTGPGAEGADGA